MAGTLVVAGLWARPLAESARQAGWRVIALDLFGDADTRRASLQWHGIGDPASLSIDPALLLDALHCAAREPGVIGWVAGSGFESIPEALELSVPGLPLLGMSAAAVRRVRDPAAFFAMLDRLGLEHPQVSIAAPEASRDWLLKNARGSGGWHIRPATGGELKRSPPDGGIYYQRIQPGQPMSALFLADGKHAQLVALNRLIVRPLGALPYVYCGAIGPIRDDALAQRIEHALTMLVPAFGLRGLASLDFIAHDGRTWLLEINPRPSASMVLHQRGWRSGLMRAHVHAVQGELPADPASHPPGVRGCLTLFADRDCHVGTALAAELAQSAHCHDLPAPGARFSIGEPVCTVSATAARAEAVLAQLDARAGQVLRRLNSPQELAA
jgi:uncharacterized protein